MARQLTRLMKFLALVGIANGLLYPPMFEN